MHPNQEYAKALYDENRHQLMILDVFTYFRLKRLARQRREDDARHTFLQRFAEFDPARVEALYHAMQRELILVRHFPILPDDRLFEDLEIDQGDLEVFVETHLPQDDSDMSSVDTCADLARYVLSKKSRPSTA
jgi:hypothetical protein